MPRAQRKEEILRSELPPTLPLMALRSTIVYPLGTIAVQMGAPENLSIIRAFDEPGLIVGLFVAGGDHDENVDPETFISRVGVAARVHERINLPGDTIQITLQGLRRIVVDDITQREPFPVAKIHPARETPLDPIEGEELMARLVSAAETLAELVDRIPDEVPSILKMNMSDPGRFADLAATNMNFRIADKDEVLQRLDIAERIRFVLSRLEREVAKARVMEDIKRQTEVKIEQHQREFYLRQQLRAIQAELGEADPGEKDAIDIFKKIEEAKLPEKVAAEARRETERMRMLSPASSEYQVIRTYLDWVLSLPWHARSGAEQIELAKVQEALDGRHYGLKEAKERIIEYLAVRKLRGGDPLGPILCFVGSPGTGKTSLGEAIAKAIGREFYRISVGGVRDEAEIRGHRRTYVGAMPGLVVQAMRRVALRDPVLMIDEIDKMTSGGIERRSNGRDARSARSVAEPLVRRPLHQSALRSLGRSVHLHGEQSLRHSRAAARPARGDPDRRLHDRGEGRDRMAVSVAEALRGARHHGQGPAVHRRDARTHLERLFARGGAARLLAQHRRDHAQTCAQKSGRRRRRMGRGSRNGGRSARLAALCEGRGRDRTRDRHGDRHGVDVHRRRPARDRGAQDAGHRQAHDHRAAGRRDARVRARCALVCAFARDAARDPRHDVQGLRHPHPFAGGRDPKDGPSAGITVTLAIASALAERPVRRNVAMTGEVTLRGKVLEVGGVKEKLMAAYRAGLREAILPKSNEKDLREIPDEVRENMTFTFASNMDEVFRLALLPPTSKGRADSAPKPADASKRGTPPEKIVPIETTS